MSVVLLLFATAVPVARVGVRVRVRVSAMVIRLDFRVRVECNYINRGVHTVRVGVFAKLATSIVIWLNTPRIVC